VPILWYANYPTTTSEQEQQQQPLLMQATKLCQMMWPVIERLEPLLFNVQTTWLETKRNLFRAGLVLLSFALAAAIPMFGTCRSAIDGREGSLLPNH
jgi:hypothetical protein